MSLTATAVLEMFALDGLRNLTEVGPDENARIDLRSVPPSFGLEPIVSVAHNCPSVVDPCVSFKSVACYCYGV